MSKISAKSKIKSVIYVMLAFILSLCLFVLSFAFMLKVTLLNTGYVMDNMNSTNYFADKKDEITRDLMDLGYASGLDESFFDSFIDEIMISSDTEKYLDSYYSGKGTVVDTTSFERTFNQQLDKYIEEKDIKSVDVKSRENLVKKAVSIYRRSLELPLFGSIAFYFQLLNKNIMIVFIFTAVLIAAIILIIIFTNRWRHRAVKYICYGISGGFLTVGIIPTVVMLSGKISQINISSRAFYNLFVVCANNIFYVLLFIAVIYFLVSVGLFFLYKNLRKKAM